MYTPHASSYIPPNTPFYFHPRFVFAFCLALTLFRIFVLWQQPYTLYADEAQYWVWSKTLDWGYYSKPPMVAWLIAGTTSVCGDTDFCIRLSSPILHFLTALIIYGIGKRLLNPHTACLAAITYMTLPGVSYSSHLISTDPPLLFFWSLSLYLTIRALQGWHIKWWVAAGFAAGFGILSKYTMLLFLPSLMLYLVFSKENRVYLKSMQFWLAVLVAFLVYLPNLIWNIHHDFATYGHTQDNASINGFAVHPDNFLEFFLGQFGVFGPLLFITLLYLIFRPKRKWFKYEHHRFLYAFTVPMMVVILLVSLLSRAHANWAVPMYVAGTVWVVGWLIEKRLVWVIFASILLHLVAIAIFYNFNPIMKLAHIEMSAKTDPFRRVRGWREMAGQIRDIQAKYPGLALVNDERRIIANMMYELRDAKGQPAEIYKWNVDRNTNDHFDLTRDAISQKGKDILLVTRQTSESFAPYFEEVREAGKVHVPLYANGQAIDYTVYKASGFKGY